MREIQLETQNFSRQKIAQDIVQTDLPRFAYIHIPFCRRRCYYCDFPISVLGNKTNINTSVSIAEYVEVLCQEIAVAPGFGQPLETVFFGGGTPSLLPVKYLERILETLSQCFGIASDAEISIEMDPGTFTLEQLQGYLQAGVNRVSLGVQAFQDELLQLCGRSHSVSDIFAAVDLIRQAGADNFSIDLISGLPHQTLEQWQASVESAIALSPKHLSCYDLVLEPVTAFGKQYQPGETPLPTDEMTAQMYRLAQQMLTRAGYQHYEISNYAREGYQCRHNCAYWENQAFYGFGMGAASYVRRQRFTRPRTRVEYYAWVQQLKENHDAIDCPETSECDRLLETLMLGLRLAEGVDLSQLCQQFGEEILEKIWTCLHPYTQQGWVEWITTESRDNSQLTIRNKIRLTDPEGFLFSNTILAALFERLG
ncbi:putative oxygen-independent coproporphyrinogen III oxidase [Pleurocapsa sp. PCC 7327]|uniref:radical SAM family heme chaperone HemW n=1 Tax=Pleurocapsa sp. PCC 7327 TaxID=118163 RepID=UPI00029FC933|nr:radical SAM family heme chaperone HemW [Pleurocapsa sp. PCC 7327]AFY79345.1 putative oxygen-independent coproporphyrinogen III oxidase [Pleurocapsa sp. PCC 7327]